MNTPRPLYSAHLRPVDFKRDETTPARWSPWALVPVRLRVLLVVLALVAVAWVVTP